MRVALVSTVAPNQLGSMGLYASLVQDALARHAPHIETLQVNLRSRQAAEGAGLSGRLKQLRNIHLARQASARVQTDVVHLLDGSFGFMATSLPLKRTLVTVHDLIPALQMQGRFPVAPPGWMARRLIESSLGMLRRAGAVHAVSHATARDVQALTLRKVDAVIPNSVRDFPRPAGATASQPRQRLVMHVGNNGFYKNRPGVLRIFAAMSRQCGRVRLVMAGPAPDDVLLAQADDLGIAQRVQWLVDPRDDQLAALYSSAAVLLFPSLYEGFGWPPLEAMAQGCPSVCANTGSLPEVVGDAALQCDPAAIDSFAGLALRLLNEPDLADALRARFAAQLGLFSSRGLAEGLLRLYQRLHESRDDSLRKSIHRTTTH